MAPLTSEALANDWQAEEQALNRRQRLRLVWGGRQDTLPPIVA